MKKPFAHLNIPLEINSSWEQLIVDFNVKQAHVLDAKQYLSRATLETLDGVDVYISHCIVWSWLKLSPTAWHIDQPTGTESSVAINMLLRGCPGQTEWVEMSKVRRLEG